MSVRILTSRPKKEDGWPYRAQRAMAPLLFKRHIRTHIYQSDRQSRYATKTMAQALLPHHWADALRPAAPNKRKCLGTVLCYREVLHVAHSS